MRIDNDIWTDSFASENHVLLSILDSASTFLTMPRSKFVSDLRNSHGSDANFDEFEAVLVQSHHDLINDTSLTIS